MDGSREQIQRPWVRHETDGEVRLATYEAASSSRKLCDQIVASVSEGLPARGVERFTGKAVSSNAPSRMCCGVKRVCPPVAMFSCRLESVAACRVQPAVPGHGIWCPFPREILGNALNPLGPLLDREALERSGYVAVYDEAVFREARPSEMVKPRWDR
jgi:hypothetical protein